MVAAKLPLALAVKRVLVRVCCLGPEDVGWTDASLHSQRCRDVATSEVDVNHRFDE